MSAFVIARHSFTRSKKPRKDGLANYRTSYYREMLDGRARFGAKAEAHRFTEPGADVVAEQLRRLMPRNVFHVIAEDARPPRPDKKMVVYIAATEQTEVFPT